MILIINNKYDESGIIVFQILTRNGYDAKMASIAQIQNEFDIKYSFQSNTGSLTCKYSGKEAKVIWLKKAGETSANKIKEVSIPSSLKYQMGV